jgi:glycosyltransferase involved in cell wall biosynthesis
MKILHIATEDIQGGAARAAYRLHRGLLALGVDSQMLVKHKTSDDQSVIEISTGESNLSSECESFSVIQNQYINNNRTAISNTLFSLPYPGYDLTRLPQVIAADIINLHWVANFQSIPTLQKLMSLGKPLVWTFHDMWAFTGGCHYSAGCIQYSIDCQDCPLLSSDALNLAPTILQDKISLWDTSNLTLVSPSKWLARCASESRLFHQSRVEIIPYSLDINIFQPLAKESSKLSLGIDPTAVTLLIGAQNGNERRKGFEDLCKALELCTQDSRLSPWVEKGKLILLCFGLPSDLIDSLHIPVVSLGQISSDQQLCVSYSAADLFILPSLEDNFPNTMLEAMCCSTPVIGFEVGGIPDLVQNNISGLTVPYRDVEALAGAIADLILSPEQRHQMSLTCRQIMEDGFSLTTQAERYINLYQNLVSPTSHHLPSSVDSPDIVTPTHDFSMQQDISVGPAFIKIFDGLKEKSFISELRHLRIELQNSRSHLTQTQTHLTHTQTQLALTQTQLAQAQTQLADAQPLFVATQPHLVETESEPTDFQTQLAQSQSQLAQSQSELAQLQTQLLNTQAILAERDTDLTQTCISLQVANARIKGMESSKFWQFREFIQKLKIFFGFGSR